MHTLEGKPQANFREGKEFYILAKRIAVARGKRIKEFEPTARFRDRQGAGDGFTTGAVTRLPLF